MHVLQVTLSIVTVPSVFIMIICSAEPGDAKEIMSINVKSVMEITLSDRPAQVMVAKPPGSGMNPPLTQWQCAPGAQSLKDGTISEQGSSSGLSRV
jgi:hypothetical protein